MDIKEIMQLGSWSERLRELKGSNTTERTPELNRRYYEGEHEILSDPDRQDFSVPVFEIDPTTQSYSRNPQTGKPIISGSKTIKRTRQVLAYPEQIVETAVAMVVGKNVDLILNNADKTEQIQAAFQILKEQWNEAKFDSFNKKMCRTLFIETHCAEFMFFEDGEPEKDLKAVLFSKENGDDIWCHFDDNRRADALVREFQRRSIVNGKAATVKVTQIHTATETWEKVGKDEFVSKTNPYKKNVWVYYDQKKPEFLSVRPLIKKQEYVHSQHSDVNVRIGNPPVVIEGNVGQLPDYDSDVKIINTKPQKDEDGKLVPSKVYLLNSTAAPESVKLEMERNDSFIYKFSWPDLSWLLSAIKTGNLSGTAIKLMFTAAEAKIVNKLEVLENLSRRISVMKVMLKAKNSSLPFEKLNIEVRFNSILPENIVELTDMFSTAVNSKITSRENAVGNLPFNENPSAIMDEIKSNMEDEAVQSASFNPPNQPDLNNPQEDQNNQ